MHLTRMDGLQPKWIPTSMARYELLRQRVVRAGEFRAGDHIVFQKMGNEVGDPTIGRICVIKRIEQSRAAAE